MRAPDAYRILRVAADSDAAVVRRSYRSLVKKYHPDLAGARGSSARLDRIIEAYRFLCDHGYLAEPPQPAPRRSSAAGRNAGAAAASQQGGDADVFRLVDLLIAGETPQTRAFAAQRLGGMGKKWTWAFLRNALNDPAEVVVKSAVGALGHLGASRCAGELASIFYRGNTELRHVVLDAVERSARPEAFDGIILEALRAEQPEVRRRALRLFAQVKREEAG
jgi:HEAT repeat protein